MTPDTSERPAAQELSPGQRAGIYARTAVDRTSERLDEAAWQVSACRKYAQQQGWQVTAVYVDNGVSGYRPKSRPGFDQMRGGLADLDRLVVLDLDRLTRHPLDLETVLDGLEQHNVELHTVDGGRVDATFARILVSTAQQVERQQP